MTEEELAAAISAKELIYSFRGLLWQEMIQMVDERKEITAALEALSKLPRPMLIRLLDSESG